MFFVIVQLIGVSILVGSIWIIFCLFRHFMKVDRYDGIGLLACGLATFFVFCVLVQLGYTVFTDEFGPFLNFDGIIDRSEREALKALILPCTLMLLVVYFTYVKTKEK